ncbi:single-stranded DNA-binding protein [Bacillus sp. AFS041924]|uniref:single-stranded DNA-binding protein n=1 Tax=Bacillus sp. AFS041924 TaxID=2033503 RepID=UPI00159BE043|nr:single-stranded DNA-binding protein [Bacillus sp. AFS041924]
MINNVVIVGRLTKEPFLQTTPNGKKTAFINIATNVYSDYLKKTRTNYVSVKLWGQVAEYASRKAKKGMEVSIEGIIKTSSYVKESEKPVYVTEIMVEKFHLFTRQSEELTHNVVESSTNDFEQFVKALQ